MSANLIMAVGVIFILAFLIILFFIPTEEKKKKKKQVKIDQEQKDWQKVAAGLERRLQSHRGDIESFQKTQKDLEKELLIEKARSKKLEEKLSQERGWQEKEKTAGDKKIQEFARLKEELTRLQDLQAKEHSTNLKLEREIKDLKSEIDSLNDQRRKAESETAQVKAQMENFRSEVRELKKDNAKLQKETDETQWIAKTEYDKVAMKLKEMEKRFERVQREK